MIQQLSVFLQNEPGKLAAITTALAEGGIDLRALSIADTTDFGILRMLVSDAAKARAILEQKRYSASVNAVTIVAVPDVPGGLAGVLTMLANEGVNIEYMYSLIGRGEDKAYMVFRATDGAKLLSALAEHGIATISNEELGIR